MRTASTSGLDSWRRRDFVALSALTALSLALSTATIIRRPDLVLGADFLFADAGHNLLVADTLLAGLFLYRDIFYPYGPLSAYVYAATAFVFGNTPTVYLALLAVISAVNVALAFVLVRRTAGILPSLMVSAALLALLPIPGAIAGAFTVSPYLVLERLLLLVVALSWTPVERSWRRSAVLGISLGLWQGVKFGGAFFAGGAVLVLDLLYLMATGALKAKLQAWVRSILVIGAAFAGVESARILLAFWTGPPALAFDTVWPTYMFQTYGTAVTGDIRWPGWGGWRLAIGQYLLPLSAGALGAVGLAGWLRRLRHTGADERAQAGAEGGVFLTLVFFVLCAFTYFRHVYHFQQFLWALVPAAAWFVQRASASLTAATLLAWLPGLLIVMRSAWLAPPPTSLIPVSLPTGGTIIVDAAMEQRLLFLRRLVGDESVGAVAYVPMGSGWHYAFGVPHPTRHTWLFAPEVVRPYEQQAFVDAFGDLRAVVACGTPGAPEPPLNVVIPLPVDMATDLYDRLELTMSEAGCWVYRIRSK